MLTSVFLPRGDFINTMMLQTGLEAPVHLELINEWGDDVWSGDGRYNQPARNLPGGLYFVRMRLMEDVASFKLSAAWGSDTQGALQNGIPLTGLSGNREDVLLTSVFLPRGDFINIMMLQTGLAAPVYLELINEWGDNVWSGDGRHNQPARNLPGGLYFVRMHLMEEVASFKLSAAWGSDTQGALQNGIPLTGLSGNRDDALLTSVFLPPETHGLTLQITPGANVILELYNAYGEQLWSGQDTQNMPIFIPQAGLYFIRMQLLSDDTAFSLTASW